MAGLASTLGIRYFHASGFRTFSLSLLAGSRKQNLLGFWLKVDIFAGFWRAAERDYYETLGVSKNASRDEIKKAFRTVSFIFSCMYVVL